MDKISGIIPNSARVSSVDMREAAPVRPGTPSFGRPEMKAAAAQSAQPDSPQPTGRPTPSLPPQMAPQSPQSPQGQTPSTNPAGNSWKSRDDRQAAIATDLSSKFFMKNDQPAPEIPVKTYEPSMVQSMSLPQVNSRPSGFKMNDEIASISAMSPRMESVMESEEEEPKMKLTQPEGLYPRGSFIDRTV